MNSQLVSQQDLVKIVLLVPDQYLETATAEVVANVVPALRDKVVVIPGCGTRHRTISRGVAELDRHHIDVTIVHDAVRPLVPICLLQQLIAAAEKFGASGPVTKLTSTVVCTDENGFLDKVLTRNQYMDSQMPQVFRQDVIREAYENCSTDDLENGTECLALVQRYSSPPISIRLIQGDPNLLWKVTYKKDLLLTLMALDDSVVDSTRVYLLTDEADLIGKRRLGVLQCLEDNLLTFTKAITKTGIRGLNGSAGDEENELCSAKYVVIRFCSGLEEFACQVRELESSSESCRSLLLIMVMESSEERGSLTPFFSELESIASTGSGHRTAVILYFLNHSQVRFIVWQS